MIHKSHCWLKRSICLLGIVSAGLCASECRAVEIIVPRVEQAPAIDGVLDDAAWKGAVVAKDFVDIKTGTPAKNQTEVKILMTDEGLYFGATLFDPDPTKLVTQTRPHDAKIWLDDDFEIFLFPTRQEGEYYQFLMNPSGSREDWHGPKDIKWNAIADWKLGVSRDTHAWYAEVFVPFAALGVERPPQGTVWWLRLSRADKQHDSIRKSETASAWVMAPGGNFNAPDANGDLVFISRNLVVNGSFEEGPAEGVPRGWKLTVDYPEQNKGLVLWDTQAATDGKRAIILQADRKKGGVDETDKATERGWVELSQELPLRAGGIYQLTADVRQFDKDSKGQGAYIWFGDQRLKLYPADKMQSITLNYTASNAVGRVPLRFCLWGHNPNPDSRAALDKVVVQEIQETLEEGLVCLTGNSIQHPKRNLKIPGTYSIFNGNTTSYDAHACALREDKQNAVVDRMLEEWLFGNVVPFDKGQLTNGKGGRLSLGNPGDTRYQIQLWWINRTIGGTVVCDLKKDYALTRVKITPSTLEISAGLLLKTDDGRTYVLVGRRSGNGALIFDKLNMRARWVAVTARAEGLKQIEIWGREETAKAQLPVPYEWPALEKPKDDAPPAAAPTFTDVGIYPHPREVKVLKDILFVGKDTPLVLVGGKPSERSRTTLQTFQADLADETGLRLTTRESADLVSLPGAAIRLSVRGQSPELEALLAKQAGTVVTNQDGYTLLVDPKTGIWLTGADEAGLFYGTRALLDLFKKQEAGLSAQAVAIRDWPRATLRGIHYTLAPTPFNDRFIRHIARLRYNAVWPIMDADTFVENYGTNAAQKMIAHCDRYFVQVMPSLCCVFLRKGMVPEKRADEPAPTGTRRTMCISDEGNRKEYLRRLSEYAPLYNSKYFNISLDEIDHYDQGSRWNCCPQCLARKLTTPELGAEWIKKVCAHLRSLGKTPMCYANVWNYDAYRGLDKLIKDDIPLMSTYSGATPRRKNIAELGCRGWVQYTTGVTPLQDNEIGGWIDNWGAQTAEGMAAQDKFAMYVRVANGFWAMSLPPPAACEPQVGRAMARLRAAVKGIPEPSFAGRADDFIPLDLSKQANEPFEDKQAGDGQGWMDEGPGRDLRALPKGKQTFLEIPFTIGDQCVIVENRARLGRTLPESIAIPIGQKLAGMVFIHTQNQTCDISTPWFCNMTCLGHYQIHYEDGTYLLHPLRYGVNIGKWDTQGQHTYENTVAWRGQTALGYPITLYLDEWINPYPEKTIARMDFCATKRPRPTRLALLAATAIRTRDYNTVVSTNRPAPYQELTRPALPEGLKMIPVVGGNYVIEKMTAQGGGLALYERLRYTAPGDIVFTTSNTWARAGEPHLTQALVDNNWYWEAHDRTALTVTFPAPRSIKALEIIGCYENRNWACLRPQDFEIETSADGTAFIKTAEIRQTIAEVDGRIPVALSGQPIKAMRVIPIRRNDYKYGTVGLAYLAMYE